MSRCTCATLGFAGFAWLLITPTLLAQNTEKSEKPARRLIRKVDVEYPWDLRRFHIGGVVRLDVLVSPRGMPDTITVLGGNPILVESAQRAVKHWRWAVADSANVVRVDVAFDPDAK